MGVSLLGLMAGSRLTDSHYWDLSQALLELNSFQQCVKYKHSPLCTHMEATRVWCDSEGPLACVLVSLGPEPEVTHMATSLVRDSGGQVEEMPSHT